MSFSDDINKFVVKVNNRSDAVVRSTVQGLADSIIMRSPVGNPEGGGPEGVPPWKSKPPKGYSGGHFRANWQLGVDAMPTGEIEGLDKTGGPTKARIKAGIPAKPAGRVYYIGNTLDYGPVLENGRTEHGGSWQAPHGMVGLAVVEFQSFINKAVGELK